MAKVGTPSHGVVGSSFNTSNDNDNDNDNVSGGFRERAVSKEAAKAPVIKSDRAQPKSFRARAIAFLKPQFMRRREVDVVWKTANRQMFEVIQAVSHRKSQAAISVATQDLVDTLKPLLREKQGAPDITHLLGSRILKLIRSMDEEEIKSLHESLGNLQRDIRKDTESPLDRVTELMAFSIRAEKLDAQARAFEKTSGKKLFELQSEPLRILDLAPAEWVKLRDMKVAASELVEAAKAYTPRDGALPGTQLSQLRLNFIDAFARGADDALKKREAYLNR